MRLTLILIVILVAAAGVVFLLLPKEEPSPEGEPEREAFERQRPEFLAIAEELDATGPDLFFPSRTIPGTRATFARPDITKRDRVRVGRVFTHMLMSEGYNDEALAVMNRVIETAENAGQRLKQQLPDLLKLRALVQLRRAEVENCIERHNAECCIFPLQGGAIHQERAPALAAREDYLRVLAFVPESLDAIWLLNLTAMALGEHPEGVPEQFRIPPEAFESEYDVGRFPDVAGELGVDAFNRCGGVITEDFDGDGRLDIVTSTIDPRGPLRFYRGVAGGAYEDYSTASRLDDQLGGLNIVGNDYDNDGDVDILVLRGAWWLEAGRVRNSLLRNDGGVFTDVTRSVGLADPARPTQAAVWADFDNDGDLDLYVGNESLKGQNHPVQTEFPSQLFINDGSGNFSEVGAEAGVAGAGFCKSVTAGDYDNDGDIDIYASTVGANHLFRNDGDLKFTDVAQEAGVTEPAGRSFASWFFDYDNDGWLDIFVSAYDANITDVAAHYLRRPFRASTPRLYKNNGDGTFANVAVESGLGRPMQPMGANFGDIDNDGWLDIYLTTGEPEYESLMPNLMFRNDGGKHFQDVTKSGGFGHLQKGHGVAFADLDEDGDQDIYHQLGGFYRGDEFRNVLFRNPGHGHRFLVIRLEGRRSNRMGFGARIAVTVETPSGARVIHRAAGSVSSFGGSPMRQEIGLGDATGITRVEVTWPASGTVSVRENVALDSRIRIVEGE